jgi:hypothetical protein
LLVEERIGSRRGEERPLSSEMLPCVALFIIDSIASQPVR